MEEMNEQMAKNFETAFAPHACGRMMEVSPSGLAARSQLVCNLAVAQLLVCFLAGLLRADSFVVAPLVALYAARERDRRAGEPREPLWTRVPVDTSPY